MAEAPILAERLAGRPPIERLTLFTPLGVRFWDAVADRQVVAGLRVHAAALENPERRVAAVRTTSGIFAFSYLPGLEGLRFGAAHGSTGGNAGTLRFVVTVSDPTLQYLPVAFHVDAPFFGVYPTDSPNGGARKPPGFYLFPGPNYAGLSNVAVLRAQIEEAGPDHERQPAAHAVVEVTFDGASVFHGFADERGQAVVMFPYPNFTLPPEGSPPSRPPAGPDGRQQWTAKVRVRYAPAALAFYRTITAPEFRSVLAQPPALVYSRIDSPLAGPSSELVVELAFGRELVLRSGEGGGLLVVPAVSPPPSP
jgi:hypothetical protein